MVLGSKLGLLSGNDFATHVESGQKWHKNNNLTTSTKVQSVVRRNLFSGNSVLILSLSNYCKLVES